MAVVTSSLADTTIKLLLPTLSLARHLFLMFICILELAILVWTRRQFGR